MANPQCPRCKSYKTYSERMILIATGFSLGGCGGFIFLIIFFPLTPILVIVGLVMALIGAFHKKKRYMCWECKEKFEVKN